MQDQENLLWPEHEYALAIRDDKKVLLLCYNITMKKYLKEIVYSYQQNYYPKQQKKIRKNIDFCHIHEYVSPKQMKFVSSLSDNSLPKHIHKEDELLDSSKDESLTFKYWIQNSYEKLSKKINEENNPYMYDAIIIDEGQDFKIRWFKLLQTFFVKNKYEILFIADPTQNIYERKAYLEINNFNKSNTGFKGPWNELKKSYRLPSKLNLMINDLWDKNNFNKKLFLPEKDTSQLLMNFNQNCLIKWTSSCQPIAIKEIVKKLEINNHDNTTDNFSIYDTTILTGTKRSGSEIAKILKNHGFKVKCAFDANNPSSQGRREKQDFDVISKDPIRISTFHSFKGWETSSLIIYLDYLTNRKLLYVALTRLCNGPNGSYLHIIDPNNNFNNMKNFLIKKIILALKDAIKIRSY